MTTARRLARLALAFGIAAALGACAPPIPSPLTPAPPEGQPSLELAEFWSIEIHAGEDAGRADELASRAQPALDVPVFVVESGGSYRVRVGRFRSRDEAVSFLPVVHEQGHRSARVVQGKREPPEPQ